MEEMQEKKIDLKKVIQDKNPGLLKILPGFVINYLRGVIHEDEINGFFRQHGSKQGIDFIDAIFEYLEVKVKITGKENIPESGGCIFASNHPLGGPDGLALIKAVYTKRKDLKFLVNDILMNIENLREFFIPVNKHGRNTPEIYHKIEEVYQSNQAVLIFPAGLVSRKQQGRIMDLEWKKTFITQAKKQNRNVIPVFIKGSNSKFFYNLARFRKSVGIKANIEMLYLADELFKQRGRTIEIIFGKEIAYSTFDNSRNDKQWAEQVKKHVYNLATDPMITFTGK